MSDAATFLQGLPLFADLDGEDLMDVLRTSRQVTFASGAALCRAGEPGDCMFVIEHGQAEVLVPRDTGEPSVRAAWLGPGDLVGDMALVDGRPRSAHVVARTDLSAYRIDGAEFRLLRVNRRPAARKVLRRIAMTACTRLRAVNAAVADLVGVDKPTEERRSTSGSVRTVTVRPAPEETRSFWTRLLDKVGLA